MLISSILQAWFLLSANHIRPDDKSNISGRNTGMSTRGGYRRVVSNKSWKHTNESESMGSDAINSWEMDSRSKDGEGLGKESFKKSQNSPHFEEGNHKRTIRSGEDVDSPLQSGIVRVFEQPGIEAPSDANASLRKPRPSSQSTFVSASSNNASGFIFDGKNNIQTSMGSWGNLRLNHQVMALTQTQLDEAMNPAQFDSRVSVKDHTSSVGDPGMPSSSIFSPLISSFVSVPP
ncbi:hypothetical protein LWI29_008838 [Acer saccharum]|uniref:Uncharacterized protein n=1 Tax=Acer saccharum TaxID=4024 RepID=A0AA39RTL8_ACESA|nr:hypothetical protein LWI29_008838 [Acer saccharum]